MRRDNIFRDLRQFEKESLYSFQNEHDACGVGLAMTLTGEKSHDIVEKGLQVLENMVHRGAESADNITGDGAGILVQIPHEFILLQGIAVPAEGRYGTGLVFLPRDEEKMNFCLSIIKEKAYEEELSLFFVRDVPVNSGCLGEIALATEPIIKQLFVTGHFTPDELERKLFILRKRVEKAIYASPLAEERSFYIVSLSIRQMIYKGMLSSIQLRQYFPDLTNPNFTSRIALVHSRFSTNTFPTWDLAQPFRMLAHNGEINTIRGNRQWMQSRESVLQSDLFQEMQDLYPVVQPDMSDSASIDNVLEFMVMSGKSLPHAMAMLVPESFNEKNPIPDGVKAFYEYHSMLMEPWDGPATLIFSDGRYAGGMLDRNGLRPARYTITHSGIMIMASETGTLAFDPTDIKEMGRLKPGKMMMIDTLTGTIHCDTELKETLANAFPYREWLHRNCLSLDEISSGRSVNNDVANYETVLKAFGYSVEDLDVLIKPMATEGKEPTSSMGNDVTIAALSDKPQRLFNYFRQQFAQVTNPPIDPIREELVMSLTGYLGAVHQNLLQEIPALSGIVKIKSPILTNTQFDILLNLRYKGFSSAIIPMLFDPKSGADGMKEALEKMCLSVEKAIDEGKNYIVLSDRGVDAEHAPIPSLLATSAVHHYLVEKRKRMQIDIVVESAEPREVMHFALLFGFGANAVNPYLVFAILSDKVKAGEIALDLATAKKNYIKAVNKGLLKVLSKMGNSTLRSYRGAHIFEAIGISSSLLDDYFEGIPSKIEGIGLDDVAHEVLEPFFEAFYADDSEPFHLNNLGSYAYRNDGNYHAWNPETIARLQIATRTNNYVLFKEFTALTDQKEKPAFIRDLLDYSRNPIDISEVEPVESIMKRFCTGAMSYGSISKEAHEAMAIAMNIIGGRSNTGEGGEDPERFVPQADGLSRRSAIKQIASGRFGVTTEYLVNADELQIKIAQGAKPGEGGQLPGFKVDEIIARTRHSIPGITLISPPPHHDIYSIEDLAQLIFDLKNVNPNAKVSVKLVSESGVGTIAAGVAKAKADLIVISGAEGGTGASPASSIKHAGLPLEIGLAETQQTLVANNLRGVVTLQTDGQLKSGRDIIVAALLGAEEFGFATSALIVLGCVMMRKCHLNTCPVGVATQNEELRKRFVGRHEYLVNFFRFLAQDTREHLAEMGFRSLDEVIGRADLLQRKHFPELPKTEKIDLSKIIYFPKEKWERNGANNIDFPQGIDSHGEVNGTKGINLGIGEKEKQVERNRANAADLPQGVNEKENQRVRNESKSDDIPQETNQLTLRRTTSQHHKIEDVLDRMLISEALTAIEFQQSVGIKAVIKNTDRAVGALLSGVIAKRYGQKGLPEHSISAYFEGSAGQSFGAFLAGGVTFYLHGDCNDYIGKGLSGGRIIVAPAKGSRFNPEENIICGNTSLYGATSGEVFISGIAGERFCVRNSGATAVVEGAGDHCCEYMTGGCTVVLGKTGRNFAAGMSGGIAYVLDEKGDFDFYCNMEMVELTLLEEMSDVRELKNLIARHHQYTNSKIAARILENWDSFANKFIKVVPIEYKKVLQERKVAALEQKIAVVERDY